MTEKRPNGAVPAVFGAGIDFDEKGRPGLCAPGSPVPDVPFPAGYERLFHAPSPTLAREVALAVWDRIFAEDEDRRLESRISELILPNGETLVMLHVADAEAEEDPTRTVEDAFVETPGFGDFVPSRIVFGGERADMTPGPHLLENRALSEMIGADLGSLGINASSVISDVQMRIETVPGALVSFASRDLESFEWELDRIGVDTRSASPEVLRVVQERVSEVSRGFVPGSDVFTDHLNDEVGRYLMRLSVPSLGIGPRDDEPSGP
ncbi:MAG: hypothetical protein DI629_20765 [Mesorhizobium amorphae]|nr:MAG: hypothetical protein DI629_20765 [Mesorhizobium amorphae]